MEKMGSDTEMCYVPSMLRWNLIHDTLNQEDVAMKCDEMWVVGVRRGQTQKKKCVNSFRKLHNRLLRRLFGDFLRHVSFFLHRVTAFRMKDTDLMLYSVMLFVTWAKLNLLHKVRLIL